MKIKDHWAWALCVTIVVNAGASQIFYGCGERAARHEAELAASCDHAGGHLNYDKTKCFGEVEIPMVKKP